MPRALAVQLMRQHSLEIGRGAVALARRLRPTFNALDDDTAERSAAATMEVLATVVETRDAGVLADFIRELARRRRDEGFDVMDIVLMSHCYMPAVRHVLVSRAPSIAQGLAAFEVVESVALPLFEKLLDVAMHEPSESTQPDGDPVETQLMPVFVRDLMTQERT